MKRHELPDSAGLTSLVIVTAVTVLVTTACGDRSGTGAAAGVARDSAGIRIIDNGGADAVLDARVVAMTDLNTPDSALTAVPWGIVAGSGRIWVLDWTGARVAAFDASGGFLGSYGREGDGPGEFRNPSAAAVDAHGVLTIWDAGRGVLSRWSRDGELLDEQRAPLSYWGPGFALTDDGLLTVASSTSGMTMEQSLVARRGDVTSRLHVVPIELAMMDLPCARMPAQKVLAPSLIWTSRGDSVFVLNGPGYRVDVLIGDAVAGSIRRDVAPIAVTSALAVASVESGPGPYGAFLQRCGITASQLANAIGYEPFVSPVQSMVLDPAGRLWVSRTTDGMSPSVLDVFAPGGSYLGSIASDVVPAAFVTDSTFAGIRVTEFGLSLALFVLRPYASFADAAADPNTGAGVGWHSLVAAIPVSARDAATTANFSSSPEADSFVLPYDVLDLPHFRDCDACPVMVELPPGEFVMGAAPGEAPAAGDATRPERAEAAEQPQVEVRIAGPFAIGKYEVTFAQWDACVAAGGCEHRPDDEGFGRAERPVLNIARRDAEQYVAWLSGVTGRPYRLPTEAEWESSRVETSTGWRDGACQLPMKRGGMYSSYVWSTRAAWRWYWHPGPWPERQGTTGLRVALTLEARRAARTEEEIR